MEKKNVVRILKYTVVVVIIASLSVALGLAVERQKQYKIELENVYQKSYYETMNSISNIETKLNKLSIVEGKTLQKVLLSDVWRESELAESNLSQLSSKNESIDSIIKFLNQLGDYCYYLAKKLDNESIEDTESDTLKKFSDIAAELRQNLLLVQAEIMKGGHLVGRFREELNFFTQSYNKMNHSTIEYPELIYDGPFSDGLNERTPRALEGMETLDEEAIKEKIIAFFPQQKVVIKNLGEVSGNIETFMFDVKVNDDAGTMQMTKKGGKLLLYNVYKSVYNPVFGEDECIEKAEQFLQQTGYEGMKAVWVSNNNSTVYINFAYVQENIIIYPDLIKIKVATDSGSIVGFEAQHYIYNHTQRVLAIPQDINYKLNPKLTLIEDNFVLVPTDWNDEVLSLEYVCQMDESIFYIYVNLETMEEERVLIVIDDDGKMLI